MNDKTHVSDWCSKNAWSPPNRSDGRKEIIIRQGIDIGGYGGISGRIFLAGQEKKDGYLVNFWIT
ncbi:Uncharacterized protein BM_BM9543 [Brugia malayi]|uniref:Bm9543 n=1 Tax=Brugia malayi TaxID=6279 RepID=A0A4E9F0T7_BRUMA|nr:Uncharacterized protein BM_BM9543 [Brugia malayi]VIO88818.1 Uncharacterized protein BM_BM9543 [Brugia malayi]